MIRASEFVSEGNNTAVYQFNEFCRVNNIRKCQIINTHYVGADGDYYEKMILVYDPDIKAKDEF